MNILITGGAGFIGSHLADALSKDNNVVVVDNFFLGNEDNLAHFKGKIIRQDATDYIAMAKILYDEKIDVVFNLATKPLEYSFDNPDDAYMVNVNIASVLLRLLQKKYYKRLIHCSTSEVYDPTTLYAAGKASVDLMIRAYNLNTSIVRPFNTYGPRQNAGRYAAIIPKTITRIMDGCMPIQHGAGNQTRDFVYIDDVITGFIKAYKHNSAEFDIATGRETKIKELITMIADEMNYKGKMLVEPSRVADVERQRGESAIQCQYTLKQGLKKTIEWYRGNL